MIRVDIPPDVIEFAYRHLPFIFCKWGARMDEAEELTQETVVTAWQCKDKFRGESKWSTWVVGVGHNIYKNHVRRTIGKKEEQYDPEFDNRPDITTPELQMEANQILNDVTSMLGGFEEIKRGRREGRKRVYSVDSELFIMWLGGSSYEEMAVTKGIPVGTVRSRLHRTLRNLDVTKRKLRGG